MIAENEMRLWNWFMIEGKYVQLSEIRHLKENKEWYYAGWHEETKERLTVNFFEAEPILLSTELLVKCGFDGKKHPKRRWKKLLAESSLTIYFEDDKISIQDYDWFMEEMPHIKHLHQLQNFYYSLTGIELKCEL